MVATAGEDHSSEGPTAALADLHEIVRLGLARGADLLTAGELSVARRIGALGGPEGVLYARLSGRVRDVFSLETLVVRGVPEVRAAADALLAAGLAHDVVTPTQRARASTRDRLAAVCRLHGLPASGRKNELVERVAALPHWDRTRWIALVGRDLVRRLERFALLSPWPDRGAWVAARLGAVRWPTYTPTTGRGLFRDRRALVAWERLLHPLTVEEAFAALEAGVARAPGRLDRSGALAEAVRLYLRAQERTDPAGAAWAYARLAATGTVRLPMIAVRWARALEAAGCRGEALEVLRRARIERDVRPSEQVAIGRSGRRIARTLRTGFPPARPLAPARERWFGLVPADPVRGVPRWSSPEGPARVERAVVAALAAHGRHAVHAEGAPWSTLFALLFAEVYFLPVPGALPVPFLSGPLDLGTAAFAQHRAEACAEVLAAVRAGYAETRVGDQWARWAGVRLRGARWDRTGEATVRALAAGVPPVALATVLETLLHQGPRAAAGLPDLIVWPGPGIGIAEAYPHKLGPGLLLAEVKGPTDAVRDEQIVWHDRLVRAGAAVEVWHITAR